MESPELRRADLPPLYSWVWVRRTPASTPVLGFFYVDRTAGPSIKGRPVRDETDPVQISRVLEEPIVTFRLPGFAYEVIGNDRAGALGLPDFPEWYLRHYDDGRAALFAPDTRPAGKPLPDGQYLEATAVSGSLEVRVCGPVIGSSGVPVRPASSWDWLLRRPRKLDKPPRGLGPDPMTLHPLDTEALAATAARGRLIAQLDRVSADATDAINALHPDPALLGYYIARQCGRIWRVAFGRLSDDQSIFLTAFEAVSTSLFGWPFDILAFTPPREDRGSLRDGARAIAVSLQQPIFLSAVDHYNYVVIREADQGNSVYWYPGSKVQGVELIGADSRVGVAPDGSVTVQPYHKSLLQSPLGGAILAHTHLLIPEPVPLDVAYSLMRRPPEPMVVVSQHWSFFISRGGSIVPVHLDATIAIRDSLLAAFEEAIRDGAPSGDENAPSQG